MTDLARYQYEDPNFGIPAPGVDDFGWVHEEQRAANLIGRALQAVCNGIGEGVIEGGIGSIDGSGDLALTALTALVADSIGPVPVSHVATTIARAGLANGVSYVHCQLGATARTDGDCGYYVSASATPAADAIAICKVTVVGGAITAVDNTVRAVPAIAERIPWEVLRRSYDDPTTLLALLTAVLGTAYLDGTRTTSIDARLTAQETGGGGTSGGGNTVYWELLQRAADNPETIIQEIAAAILQHVTDAHTGAGGDGGASGEIPEPWDGEAAITGHTVMRLATVLDGLLPARLRNAMVYIPGAWGAGATIGGYATPEYRDTA